MPRHDDIFVDRHRVLLLDGRNRIEFVYPLQRSQTEKNYPFKTVLNTFVIIFHTVRGESDSIGFVVRSKQRQQHRVMGPDTVQVPPNGVQTARFVYLSAVDEKTCSTNSIETTLIVAAVVDGRFFSIATRDRDGTLS